jgi:hypothetical protein
MAKKTFEGDPRCASDVLLALEHGRNLSFFGKDKKCEQWERAELKRIQKAYDEDNAQDEV